MDMIYLAAIAWLVCGIAALLIAQSKGMTGPSWFIVGFLLGPLGVILALATAKPAVPVEFAPTKQASGGVLGVVVTVMVGVIVAAVILSSR